MSELNDRMVAHDVSTEELPTNEVPSLSSDQASQLINATFEPSMHFDIIPTEDDREEFFKRMEGFPSDMMDVGAFAKASEDGPKTYHDVKQMMDASMATKEAMFDTRMAFQPDDGIDTGDAMRAYYKDMMRGAERYSKGGLEDTESLKNIAESAEEIANANYEVPDFEKSREGLAWANCAYTASVMDSAHRMDEKYHFMQTEDWMEISQMEIYGVDTPGLVYHQPGQVLMPSTQYSFSADQLEVSDGFELKGAPESFDVKEFEPFEEYVPEKDGSKVLKQDLVPSIEPSLEEFEDGKSVSVPHIPRHGKELRAPDDPMIGHSEQAETRGQFVVHHVSEQELPGKDVQDFFKSVSNKANDLIGKGQEAIGSFVNGIKDGTKDLADGVKTGAETIWNKLVPKSPEDVAKTHDERVKQAEELSNDITFSTNDDKSFGK